MNQHPLFLIITIMIIGMVLLFIPIWVLALSKSKLKPFDFIFPFLPLFFWFIISAVGIGAQNISNLIEIPIIIFFTLIGSILTMFSPYTFLRSKKGSLLILSTLIIFVLLLRVFMPAISE